MPRSNEWSFEQQVWHLVQLARNAIPADPSKSVGYLIDRGNECVGLAAQIIRLLEPDETEVSNPEAT
jgi:hypothetical protein